MSALISLSQLNLQNLSNLDNLPIENIQIICKYFLQTLIKGNSSIALENDLDDSLCVISTLLLEASKCHADEKQIESILLEQGVRKEISQIILSIYSDQKDVLMNHVESTGISAPEIIGIDWRLDYSIHSKHGGRENIPIYFLALKVMDRGIPRIINMTANFAELQDLLAKVKDAVKQVDREVAMTDII